MASQSAECQSMHGQSAGDAILTELRNTCFSFVRAIKDISSQVDELSEKVYNPPPVHKKRIPESILSLRAGQMTQRKLDQGHNRPVGPECNSVDRLRFSDHHIPAPPTERGAHFLSGKQPYLRGNRFNAQQGSNPGASMPSNFRSRGGFLLHPVHSPQEGQRHEASNKPQKPESIHPPAPLQDGEDAFSKGLAEGRRLDDKGGSESCLFHDFNSGSGQKIPVLLQVTFAYSSSTVHLLASPVLHGSLLRPQSR